MSEPPVPRDLVVEDGEGYLALAAPWEGNEHLHHAFDAWLAGFACPHERMELVSVRVASWPFVRRFQQAVRSAGPDRFPVLCCDLPDANGGQLPPARARAMLAELGDLARADLAGETWLVDDGSAAPLAVHLAAYGGVVVWHGGSRHEVGVDDDGFFVRDVATAPARDVFRSRRFDQERLGGYGVRFTDVDTRTTATVAGVEPVCGEDGGRWPRRLRVENRPVTPHDFATVVESLTAACTAAVATGNPVVWC